MRAVQTFFLQPWFARPLSKVFKRIYAIEGNNLRRVLFQLLGQHDAPLGEFLAVQFLGRARRALDQVREPDAEFNHPLVIPVIQQFRHDTRIVQQRPEFVSTAGIIVPYASGTIAGITSHDDQFHSCAQIIG